MFQFPRFASYPYVFRIRYCKNSGFPHSDIDGSKVVRTSPSLIAAYHVFHRLLMPRHPPNALKRFIEFTYSEIHFVFKTNKIVFEFFTTQTEKLCVKIFTMSNKEP